MPNRSKAYCNRYKSTKPIIYKDGNEWVLFKGGFSCYMDTPKDCLIKASSLRHYKEESKAIFWAKAFSISAVLIGIIWIIGRTL